MEDTRKGFLTPEQEKTVDNLIELKGIAEMLDGTAIGLLDNQGLERLKSKMVEKWGVELLPDIYEVIDVIFLALTQIEEQ
ncbi:MAG: hypothetical protein HN347_16155 [Bacteroidetes bacterium]|jgi:hypothetical protein|nr:hypothetical protein [Bacteroidota bacterium]